MARCILLQGNLPQSLWGEAVNSAVYLRNRCATKTLEGKTPYEAWTKRKPYVNYFRIIGTRAIVLDKTQKRGKFQPKGDEYILVGYSEYYRSLREAHRSLREAYRFWKPGTKTVIKARDVKFFETVETTDFAPNDIFDIPENKKQDTNEKDASIFPKPANQTEDEDEDSEDEDDIPKKIIDDNRRAPGRPKLLRTGKPERPKKIYQCNNITV